jgi:hypothetical protein
VNATNENLRQYVRAYFELMLEVRHMHEMDHVCQFAMGLLTWAKRKLEESWPASYSEAITKVENFSDALPSHGGETHLRVSPKSSCGIETW